MNKDGIYIVQGSSSCYSSPFKIKVLEVTDTTYYIHNLDVDKKFRETKDQFSFRYKVIETISEVDINSFMDSVHSIHSEIMLGRFRV